MKQNILSYSSVKSAYKQFFFMGCPLVVVALFLNFLTSKDFKLLFISITIVPLLLIIVYFVIIKNIKYNASLEINLSQKKLLITQYSEVNIIDWNEISKIIVTGEERFSFHNAWKRNEILVNIYSDDNKLLDFFPLYDSEIIKILSQVCPIQYESKATKFILWTSLGYTYSKYAFVFTLPFIVILFYVFYPLIQLTLFK